MKKIILSALVVLMAIAVQAQEIPERKTDKPLMHARARGQHNKGMNMQQLNLTPQQKIQIKQQRENFHSQIEELKKNDGITVKESRERMESFRKENKEKTQRILTADQKAKLQQMKVEGKAQHMEMARGRAENMKTRLGLSDEQSAKMEKNKAEMAKKIKAVHENKSLSEQNKKEQMKELMKGQREQMKSILTDEQLKKMKERKHSGHKEGMNSTEKNTKI